MVFTVFYQINDCLNLYVPYHQPDRIAKGGMAKNARQKNTGFPVLGS
jgi:hypothetical protein